METMTVKRKDNGKIKTLLPENFDPEKHELIDAHEAEEVVTERQKHARRK